MSDTNEEAGERGWYPYENGETIGQIGPERGFILRDEEFGDPDDDEDADARLTLEQGRADNPGFFVTATLYGWLFHTYRVRSEADANSVYDAMKNDLTALTDLLPYEEDRDLNRKIEQLGAAIASFEANYS